MKCGSCHFFSAATFSGLCTNPSSFKCGEYVGESDYSCGKWQEKRAEEPKPESKSTTLCGRCSHKDVCSSIFKDSLWLNEILKGQDPVCKHFHEVIPCKECKHYHEETCYCELNSYFVDSDGMCCSPAESPNWEMWEPDETCSRAERREDC